VSTPALSAQDLRRSGEAGIQPSATRLRSLIQAPTPETFDLWAESYDTQLNPFLSLEQRIVKAILPELRGKAVLDAGCGTGRWLSELVEQNPSTLIGVDSSPAMLTSAAKRTKADLRVGDCTALPVEDATIDFILSSFVVSYIADLEAFAAELARVTQPGATVFLSDLHPETARTFNWRRTFSTRTGEIEIQAHRWNVEALIAVFAAHGFQLSARIEPTFSSPEQAIFSRANKLNTYGDLLGHAAICVLAFTRSAASTKPVLTLSSARVALSAHDSIRSSLHLTSHRVASISIPAPAEVELDLSGYLILPGLINAHDHLEFGLFPRLGHGPYQNSKQWGEDIHARNPELIALHRSIPRETRIHWGGLRNLLCGVTTVCHHNPLTPEMFAPGFPVTVLEDFDWAHSIALDPQLAAKSRAADPEHPFILHAAEGIDASSAAELAYLHSLGLLNDRTILVHGLALTPAKAELLNQYQTALIACPSSNQFLFGRSPARDLLASVLRLALGSDSPLTAAGDLLDEIRFTHKHLGLDAGLLYRAVTTASAEMLRLRNSEGRILPNAPANLIAIKDRPASPANRLSHLTAHDVEFVLRRGQIFLASEEIYFRLPQTAREGLEPLLLDGEARWLRAPLAKLFHEAAPVMRDGILHLAGKELRHGHDHAA
jgi:cytosine/adenosine deaminase-related metal-dependent hydrolase/ubiquinone/menaquinone biosynthesis C-methylase UbiE